MFSTQSKTKIIILTNSILCSENAFNLDQSRILSFGKKLIYLHDPWRHVSRHKIMDSPPPPKKKKKKKKKNYLTAKWTMLVQWPFDTQPEYL